MVFYKKAFSRDFSLVSLEIWWRGEVKNEKIWTRERQPFLPYIVFEKKKDTVDSFYDPRGISWIKHLLLERINDDKNFLFYLEKNFFEGFSLLKNIFDVRSRLNHSELCNYFHLYEKNYIWFEAVWWLWDMTGSELKGVILPETLKQLRENTQDFVPKSEQLIKNSLENIYSEISNYIKVLRISEIEKNQIPDVSEFIKREQGYYFTDDKLFVGSNYRDIERMYNLKFEKINTDNISNFIGEVAYKGKVSGRVKLILSLKNINKVEDGDVLVSTMTLPDFFPAIKKAVAIITDEGGLLSHAAIIARELKKPCIIGAKIAVQVLKDGDLVEVDADNGIVKILKRAVESKIDQ